MSTALSYTRWRNLAEFCGDCAEAHHCQRTTGSEVEGCKWVRLQRDWDAKNRGRGRRALLGGAFLSHATDRIREPGRGEVDDCSALPFGEPARPHELSNLILKIFEPYTDHRFDTAGIIR